MEKLILRSFLAVFAVALGLAPAASAQIVIDDFEDGELPMEFFVFGGGEPGVAELTADTPDGSSFALQFDVDADEYGGFTGFGQPIDGGAADVTDFDSPVFVFDAAATGTFTLEINFQNTGGGGEGEIRNALRFVDGDGTYQRYRLPLSSFFTTNEASFEFDDVFQYVFTVAFAEGDSDPGTMETTVQIDNVQIQEGLGFESTTSAYDFDDGDFSDTNGFFYFAGGEGIAAAPTTDTPDGSANAFSGQIDGDEFNGFAGFGNAVEGSPFDASSFEALNFFLRANGPAILEVNLQTVEGSGNFEARERIQVSDTDGEYVPVSIPLEALIQSGANAPDFSQVVNFVFTFVEVPGDSDVGTTEFEFAIDALGFGVQTPPVAAESLPEVFASAPVTFPNPTAGAATVAFDLATPSALTVDVLDVLGRRVLTLANGTEAAGTVRLGVPAGALAPGTYLVRVSTEAGVAATRLTVAR